MLEPVRASPTSARREALEIARIERRVGGDDDHDAAVGLSDAGAPRAVVDAPARRNE
jgi:hypothetical protein